MKKVTFILLIACIFITSCTQKKDQKNDQKFKIVATTGMLYDAALNIAKEKANVEALMGPGVDPHLYKASQGDLAKFNEADLIIYNGLLLEGKMGEILSKIGRTKPVVAAAQSIPPSRLLTAAHYENAFDPHIWFDVELWKYAVSEISIAIQKLDTANINFYKSNTSTYLASLDSLHQYVKSEIATIPKKQRILVTAHDAFGYFGRAYDIEVVGLQGISTVSDFGLKDISNLTDLIIDNNVKAIFVETSVSDKAIKAVVTGCQEKGNNVVIGGNLFSDAMGPFGTYEGTYIGMVSSNVKTIVEALK
jgi:manganese/zinc/iron transport system substrate-binding protein